MYNGKKVLVTGAGGFIGSHLVESLVESGAEVQALVQYRSDSKRGWLDYSKILNDVEVVSGDIRDPFQARNIVSGKDIVFNLAALIGIPYSYIAPSRYIETNVTGALNILEAIRTGLGGRLVQMSTSEVYGSAIEIPMDENHPLHAQSPYSASKIAADSLAISYFRSFGTSVVIARPFNNYGPRQSRRAVIPTIITQVLSGQDPVQLGNIKTTRDFVYVSDTCRALLKLGLANDVYGEVVNIGTGKDISIAMVFDLVKQITGSSVSIEVDDNRVRPDSSEVFRLICCNKKLIHTIGSMTFTSLKEGLSQSVEWYSQNADRFGKSQHVYYV